ncbi:MAG: hypothetical protein AB8G77_27275 [Rhodothermales bacterium]
MNKAKKIIGYFLGVFLIAGAIGHIVNPDLSTGLIPEGLPVDLVHIVAALVEFVLGVGVFIPKYRTKALQGICILMILFLPLHIFDVFRENPVVGSLNAALFRLFMQFVLIYLPWYAGGKLNAKVPAEA